MKVLVIGAAGKTGRAVVEQAVAAGHQVTAFVRKAGDSEVNASMYERLLISTLLRGADKDKAAMESAVESSGLDWVILRPAILTDDPAKGNVRVFDAETGEGSVLDLWLSLLKRSMCKPFRQRATNLEHHPHPLK